MSALTLPRFDHFTERMTCHENPRGCACFISKHSVSKGHAWGILPWFLEPVSSNTEHTVKIKDSGAMVKIPIRFLVVIIILWRLLTMQYVGPRPLNYSHTLNLVLGVRLQKLGMYQHAYCIPSIIY